MFKEYGKTTSKQPIKRNLSYRIKSFTKQQPKDGGKIQGKIKIKQYFSLPKFTKTPPQYVSQKTLSTSKKQVTQMIKLKDYYQTKQLPFVSDDYNKRIPLFSEIFCLIKTIKKSMHVILSVTQRFYYVTIEKKQSPIQHKLRLTYEVGQHIMRQIKKHQIKINDVNQNLVYKSRYYFRDKIHKEKDESNRTQYYLIIPWQISFRKYRFTRLSKRNGQSQNTQEDRFIRLEIDRLGRQSSLFTNIVQ